VLSRLVFLRYSTFFRFYDYSPYSPITVIFLWSQPDFLIRALMERLCLISPPAPLLFFDIFVLLFHVVKSSSMAFPDPVRWGTVFSMHLRERFPSFVSTFSLRGIVPPRLIFFFFSHCVSLFQFCFAKISVPLPVSLLLLHSPSLFLHPLIDRSPQDRYGSLFDNLSFFFPS